MIDLTPEHLKAVLRILAEHAPDVDVLAYGSRVRGTARTFSDLDIALRGPEPLPRHRVEALKDAFAESNLPFQVDVVDWNSITPEFRALIEQGHEIVRQAGQPG